MLRCGGFNSSASIARALVISLRAVRNNSLNSPYPNSLAAHSGLRLGLIRSSEPGAKPSGLRMIEYRMRLFDLRLLPGVSAFNRVDEIQRRQAQLVETQFFRLQDLSGRRVQLLD